MIETTIRKQGGSRYVVIPSDIADMLNWDVGTKLQVTVDGVTLHLYEVGALKNSILAQAACAEAFRQFAAGEITKEQLESIVKKTKHGMEMVRIVEEKLFAKRG